MPTSPVSDTQDVIHKEIYGKQLLAFRWQSKRGKVEVLLTKVMERDVPQGWSGFPADAESTPEKVAEAWIGVSRPKIVKVGRGSPDLALIVTKAQEAAAAPLGVESASLSGLLCAVHLLPNVILLGLIVVDVASMCLGEAASSTAWFADIDEQEAQLQANIEAMTAMQVQVRRRAVALDTSFDAAVQRLSVAYADAVATRRGQQAGNAGAVPVE